MQKLAVSEIVLLIIGIIAFSCLLGQSLPIVSAEETNKGESTSGISIGNIPIFGSIIDTIAKLFGKGGATSAPIVTEEIAKTKFLAKYLGTKGSFVNVLSTAGVVTIIVVVYTYISTLIKTGDPARAADAALRVGIGASVGLATYYLIALLSTTGPAGWIAGALVLIGAYLSKYLKRAQDRQIDFICKPWQSKTGGANCGECDNQDFPCTEYQCRSLGTGCELINKDTDEPRCVWKDPNDVNAPKIQPWEDALIDGYSYVPLPPVEGTGVEIKYTGKECLPFFQPFTFGVELDKEGYCKIDYERTPPDGFNEMRYDFGGTNLYKKNHTQQMSFPGIVHMEEEARRLAINLTHDGEYEFYVRCMAASNGKANRDEFLFKFCIDKGPDTTSPEIRGFNWPDQAPIAYFKEGDLREVNVQVYVNEPAQCKWDHKDTNYAEMENSLTCSNSVGNFNAQLSYSCTGKLTGLENNQQNKFYFRCNDSFGNVNIQSKPLTLIGTRPLAISSVKPNATTIKDSTNSIKVTLKATTSEGYKQGEATCYYSPTGAAGSYIIFSNTNSYTHSEDRWLGPGNYDLFIRCIDLAGNSDNKEISFTVETDTSAPTIVRVFREGQNLKIITDEEASCVYDNIDCLYNFDDGITLGSEGGDKIHSIVWNPDKNFYIKCQDEFENQPAPQSCSLVVRAFEI